MNIDIFVQRIAYTKFGVMSIMTAVNKTFVLLTDPWVATPEYPAGQPEVSCIPDGTYQGVLHNTPDHPNTIALVNPDLGVFHNPGDVPEDKKVWARTDCLIHNANFVRQVQGCHAIGEDFAIIEDEAGDKKYKLAVTNSEEAMIEFQKLINGASTIRVFIRPGMGAMFAGPRNLN